MDFSLPRAGGLARAFFVIRAQYAAGDSGALQMLQHQAPMLRFPRREHARERHHLQAHPLGTIEPRTVTLETEHATAGSASVGLVRGTGHLDPPPRA